MSEATTRVVRIHETGGPEVLRFEEIPLPEPGPGEVLLRQEAAGLNFIDTYHRTGLYPAGDLPAVLGREAAGVVERIGDGVEGWRPGDRVAYVLDPGGYAERRTIRADRLIRLPDAIDATTAAGLLLKGLTAHFLLHRTYRVRPGDTILIHAAAGGVGSIAVRWAKRLGATVIGTVGTEEKARQAREAGCDHPVLYREVDFVEAVREITGGRMLPVVYDSVGRDTFLRSLDCLRPRGLMVSFGQSSGALEPFAVGTLAAKGSLYLTRPTLADYVRDPNERAAAARALFDAVADGAVRADVRHTYPLAEAERAHRDLEARRTSGSAVLLCG